ncbi:hypothetical protein SARC_01390 [Sphaeroforma arctica JP610]|uniref:Uncharacterized protein n=1 Tax=Sphaeroforma arctica JP610 TaxID=667725 RepID=A0A0L0GBU3_9EUKA|nr:hypothetical protein SARC_01390 [Sphaeroforma arctica JP610]KNC86482.1 hypothetical protein SARC_01390 [Sphaeroforma arctica JP610]|eukprot:XP_014160384.1 hypothetical protein SARC_01390 [Sphaeroforma arctica JP610]
MQGVYAANKVSADMALTRLLPDVGKDWGARYVTTLENVKKEYCKQKSQEDDSQYSESFTWINKLNEPETGADAAMDKTADYTIRHPAIVRPAFPQPIN